MSISWPCFTCAVKWNAGTAIKIICSLSFLLPGRETSRRGVKVHGRYRRGRFDLQVQSGGGGRTRPALHAEPVIKTQYWFLRFSPLVSGTAPIWPSLSSQKTITRALLPRHWQGQGGRRWIGEDYYFHSGIQFKPAPGRRWRRRRRRRRRRKQKREDVGGREGKADSS